MISFAKGSIHPYGLTHPKTATAIRSASSGRSPSFCFFGFLGRLSGKLKRANLFERCRDLLLSLTSPTTTWYVGVPLSANNLISVINNSRSSRMNRCIST